MWHRSSNPQPHPAVLPHLRWLETPDMAQSSGGPQEALGTGWDTVADCGLRLTHRTENLAWPGTQKKKKKRQLYFLRNIYIWLPTPVCLPACTCAPHCLQTHTYMHTYVRKNQHIHMSRYACKGAHILSHKHTDIHTHVCTQTQVHFCFPKACLSSVMLDHSTSCSFWVLLHVSWLLNPCNHIVCSTSCCPLQKTSVPYQLTFCCALKTKSVCSRSTCSHPFLIVTPAAYILLGFLCCLKTIYT